MRYRLFRTNQFKRAYKKLSLNDSSQEAFIDVVYKLLNDIGLDPKYRNHLLSGEFAQYQECHLKPDLLLIYSIEDDMLKLVDIGSHSELFG
jgi:mRNA interferase YafQ